MRSNIEYQAQYIVKSAESSTYVAKVIKSKLLDYQKWLAEVGISSVPTEVTFQNGVINFKQVRLIEGQYSNPRHLVKAFQKLDFQKFGLDSNPGNFIGSNMPIFVDFFPFLIKNARILKAQFKYSEEEIYQRYFTVENVVATYIVRLFKHDEQEAVIALQEGLSILIDAFDTILPREKLRLWMAMQMKEMGRINGFPIYYRDSKRYVEIDLTTNQSLYSKLVEIAG